LKTDQTKLSPAAILILVSLALYLAGRAATVFSPGTIFGGLADIGLLGLIGGAVFYIYRSLRWLGRNLLWRVRNRILLSYAFIGIVPVALILIISGLALSLIFRQLSNLYLQTELERVWDRLAETNDRIILAQLRHNPSQKPEAESLLAVADRVLESVPDEVQRSIFTLYRSPADNPTQLSLVERKQLNSSRHVAERAHPEWLRRNFQGTVSIHNELFLTDVRTFEAGQELFFLTLHLPFDQNLLEDLYRRTSIEIVMPESTPAGDEAAFRLAYSSFRSSRSLLAIPWVHFFNPIDWETGESLSTRAFLMSVPLWILFQHLFANAAGPVLLIFQILGATFLVVEVLSLAIAGVLARSITRSVHNIHTGTRHISRGNFDYRIPIGRRDQLGEMAASLNQMASSISQLLTEVSHKERLEKELEIAREVQLQLYPRSVPSVPGVEIAASSTPAREVSGDYYDFVSHSGGSVDIVIGDISGKGISAALLMASIQSLLRSHLEDWQGVQPGREASILCRLNRQLYRHSAPNRFSTLVLGHLNAENLTFRYCNAGHNPPLVFSGRSVRKLETGGTVIGLFEGLKYQEELVQTRPGDLILLYTDGVIEATSLSGEEFGEERLVRLISENRFLTAEDIRKTVIEEVQRHSGREVPEDDITLVCLKILEDHSSGKRKP